MAATQPMPKPQNFNPSQPQSNVPRVQAIDMKEDLVEYLTCYARQNPAHAALFCLGVGFILGWKLKPW